MKDHSAAAMMLGNDVLTCPRTGFVRRAEAEYHKRALKATTAYIHLTAGIVRALS